MGKARGAYQAPRSSVIGTSMRLNMKKSVTASDSRPPRRSTTSIIRARNRPPTQPTVGFSPAMGAATMAAQARDASQSRRRTMRSRVRMNRKTIAKSTELNAFTKRRKKTWPRKVRVGPCRNGGARAAGMGRGTMGTSTRGATRPARKSTINTMPTTAPRSTSRPTIGSSNAPPRSRFHEMSMCGQRRRT